MTTSIPLCIKCARFNMPPRVLISDGYHYCGLTLPISPVTGKAVFPELVGVKATCEYQRSQAGLCGLEGKRFVTELSAEDFQRVPDASSASINGHGLDEASEKHRVFLGESATECRVDLDHGCSHVVANDSSSQDGIPACCAD